MPFINRIAYNQQVTACRAHPVDQVAPATYLHIPAVNLQPNFHQASFDIGRLTYLIFLNINNNLSIKSFFKNQKYSKI